MKLCPAFIGVAKPENHSFTYPQTHISSNNFENRFNFTVTREGEATPNTTSLWSVVAPGMCGHVVARQIMTRTCTGINAMHDAIMPLLDHLARPPVCWLLVGSSLPSTRFHCASTAGHLSRSLAVALPLGVPRDVRYASQQVCAVCGVCGVWCVREPFATDGELCDPYCSVLSRSVLKRRCKEILLLSF